MPWLSFLAKNMLVDMNNVVSN